jgi:hypothetical protein
VIKIPQSGVDSLEMHAMTHPCLMCTFKAVLIEHKGFLALPFLPNPNNEKKLLLWFSKLGKKNIFDPEKDPLHLKLIHFLVQINVTDLTEYKLSRHLKF